VSNSWLSVSQLQVADGLGIVSCGYSHFRKDWFNQLSKQKLRELAWERVFDWSDLAAVRP